MTAVDKELEELRQNIEIYTEISNRLYFDNNELIERERASNMEIHSQISFAKITVRIRGLSLPENQLEKPPIITYDLPKTTDVSIKYPEVYSKGETKHINLSFDHIITPLSSDARNFEEIEQLVFNSVDGFNSNIFL